MNDEGDHGGWCITIAQWRKYDEQTGIVATEEENPKCFKLTPVCHHSQCKSQVRCSRTATHAPTGCRCSTRMPFHAHHAHHSLTPQYLAISVALNKRARTRHNMHIRTRARARTYTPRSPHPRSRLSNTRLRACMQDLHEGEAGIPDYNHTERYVAYPAECAGKQHTGANGQTVAVNPDATGAGSGNAADHEGQPATAGAHDITDAGFNAATGAGTGD